MHSKKKLGKCRSYSALDTKFLSLCANDKRLGKALQNFEMSSVDNSNHLAKKKTSTDQDLTKIKQQKECQVQQAMTQAAKNSTLDDWTVDHEGGFMKFKRLSSRKSTAAILGGFILTPEFRNIYLNQQARNKRDQISGRPNTPENYKSFEVDNETVEDVKKKQFCAKKRMELMDKTVRDHLENSLAATIVNNFEEAIRHYSQSRQKFLHRMLVFSRQKRRIIDAKKQEKDDLYCKQKKTKKTVQKMRDLWSHAKNEGKRWSSLETLLFDKNYNEPHEGHNNIWQKVIEEQSCNLKRSLSSSKEYIINTHSKGGGNRKVQEKQRIKTLTKYINIVQRMYRGHLCRRYVWSMCLIDYLWSKVFFTDDEAAPPGYIIIGEFEKVYEFLCYNITFEKIYLAGFTLTTPASSLGANWVNYDRFANYWQRNKYRASSFPEMIKFTEFVTRLQQQNDFFDPKMNFKKNILENEAQFKKYKSCTIKDINQKYNLPVSQLNAEYKELLFKARRQMINARYCPKGWKLLKEIVCYSSKNILLNPNQYETIKTAVKETNSPLLHSKNKVNSKPKEAAESLRNNQRRQGRKLADKVQTNNAKDFSKIKQEIEIKKDNIGHNKSKLRVKNSNCKTKDKRKKIISPSNVSQYNSKYQVETERNYCAAEKMDSVEIQINKLLECIKSAQHMIRSKRLSEEESILIASKSALKVNIANPSSSGKQDAKMLLERQEHLNEIFKLGWASKASEQIMKNTNGRIKLSATRRYIDESVRIMNFLKRSISKFDRCSKKVHSTSSNILKWEKSFDKQLKLLDTNLLTVVKALEHS